MSKVLIWDIESTNLAANFGYIICIGYKWLGEKEARVICIDQFPEFKNDPTNDKEVVKAFAKVYEEADVVVAHYGQKFDVPMVNTKLISHGLPPLPNTKLIDTWRIAKDKLRLNSNRLATLISALGVKYKKTELDGPTWIKAMSGNRGAIKYVREHCLFDVLALEEVYKKIIVLKSEALHPSMHTCHPKFMRSNGNRICDKKMFRRMFCLKCGGWFKGEVVK